MKEQMKVELNEEKIRILKTGSCESLSGRSMLTYEIGCKEDKTICIRLTENSGAGMYSKAWLPMLQITQLLSADDKPIASRTINPLYTGSANSCGFMLAVLRNEGLIKNVEENSRGYMRCDPSGFNAAMKVLIDTGNESALSKPAKEKKTKKPIEPGQEDC